MVCIFISINIIYFQVRGILNAAKRKEKFSKPGLELWSLCRIFEFPTTKYYPRVLKITTFVLYLTSLRRQITLFCDVMPCSLVKIYRRFDTQSQLPNTAILMTVLVVLEIWQNCAAICIDRLSLYIITIRKVLRIQIYYWNVETFIFASTRG
jgi:hypothetical protein